MDNNHVTMKQTLPFHSLFLSITSVYSTKYRYSWCLLPETTNNIQILYSQTVRYIAYVEVGRFVMGVTEGGRKVVGLAGWLARRYENSNVVRVKGIEGQVPV